ncbi:hypothetical protein COCMIDRAFT_92058 [Bipolaris oryzae ATCC 44560]|uniref:Zn(2)-C6 fungal-type domain-containing protein n=1 Tax=Bipolaris oryzae ATCC 44560 TaxID=930090 RepID=W6ZH25_COCMI|nr:uncharacterized protein COCMIDRAFT_92058 [Bipolaris oryzae ATCC 44560]EUC46719.1 hypothetical protein COCMIDRAFT_92058 [Bipolaris oryzae ATCC 44560]
MSFVEYEGQRPCLSHNNPYQTYIYDDRHASSTLGHNTRENPRSYPVGGPVGGMHTRAMMGGEDHMVETGPVRRRIAVACARCRKRKIRCSGDPGNGTGCLNCRAAGVESIHCQFHRVGSDVVHKVIDNINIAHGLNNMAGAQQMIPVYQTGGNNTFYQRAIPIQYSQYPTIDTKSTYAPAWTVPFPEDASPVEAFNLEQPPGYIPNTASMTNANIYGSSYRGSDPGARSLGGACFDQESFNSLPCATSNGRVTPSDISPLDTGMSSLHLSLPERPRPRQTHPSEPSVTRRHLPIPQPNPAQSNRNAVDKSQDERLRSARVSGSSAINNRGSFARPPMPWVVEGGNQANVSGVSPTNDAKQVIAQPRLHDGTENPISYFSTTGDITATSTGSQLDLAFSTSGLLDGMSASAQAAAYSCVRGSHHIAPGDPQSNIHSFENTHSTKRNSTVSDLPSNHPLGTTHRYTPLNHSPPQNSFGSRKPHREACHGRSTRLQRTSVGSLKANY